MQYSFFIEDLWVAASMDQLMEEYEAHMTPKMSEVMQKQKNESFNI